tara:strand:- start:202 stop:1107 length:906 start_codon:yes stop_codon:yes gene_type:complete
MRKLPVFASVGEVLSGVIRHYFQLLVVAWPAVIFLLAGAGFVVWQYANVGLFRAYVAKDGAPDMTAIMTSMQDLSTSGMMALIWGANLVLLVASAVAAVRWHRFVLLGEGADNLGSVRLLRAEDGRYIWALIKIFLLMIAVMMVVSAVFGFVFAVLKASEVNLLGQAVIVMAVVFVAFLLWGYTLLFRLMLALPDASVSRGGRIFAVFSASAGNGWRLLGLFALVALVYFVVSYVIIEVLRLLAGTFGINDFSSPALLIPAVVLYLGLYLFAVMTQVTMLSVAYREIIGLPVQESSPDIPT